VQINQVTLPMLVVLRAFGLNRHVRGWNRILSRLFPHDAQVSRHLATTRWGLTYLANPANYVDWDVLCHGSFEHDDLELFRRFGRPESVCLDIGANIGHHAVFFGSLGWTVHAFEPNPQLWAEFEAKIRASGLQAVTLHKVGLGIENASLEFELENSTNSGTGRFRDGNPSPPEGGAKVGRLPIRNGDRYLEESGIDHVDVVKMDIQGFEPEALVGLRETLRRDRPLISVEIAPDNTVKFGSFERFKEYLPEAYSFLRVRPMNVGLLRRTVVECYTGEAFHTMSGNLFCIPDPRFSPAQRD